MGLFGVRTLYLWKIKSQSPQMVEERIILVKARTSAQAISKARKEAKKYAGFRYKNVFGKVVKTHVLKLFDAFEITESLKDGAEVFSSNFVLEKSKTEGAIVAAMAGAKLSRQKEKRLRGHFRSA